MGREGFQLVRDTVDSVTAPAVHRPEHYQLRLLARVIMPTLERLYIVVGLLSRNGPGTLTREVLQRRSGDVARRMSRLYGLNAPEFFDARLFNQFVDALVRRDVVWPGPGGELQYAPLIDDVLKASENVIDPDFRYAVRQAH